MGLRFPAYAGSVEDRLKQLAGPSVSTAGGCKFISTTGEHYRIAQASERKWTCMLAGVRRGRPLAGECIRVVAQEVVTQEMWASATARGAGAYHLLLRIALAAVHKHVALVGVAMHVTEEHHLQAARTLLAPGRKPSACSWPCLPQQPARMPVLPLWQQTQASSTGTCCKLPAAVLAPHLPLTHQLLEQAFGCRDGRMQLWVRVIPHSIQIKARQVAAIVAHNHPIWVQHGDHLRSSSKALARATFPATCRASETGCGQHSQEEDRWQASQCKDTRMPAVAWDQDLLCHLNASVKLCCGRPHLEDIFPAQHDSLSRGPCQEVQKAQHHPGGIGLPWVHSCCSTCSAAVKPSR